MAVAMIRRGMVMRSQCRCHVEICDNCERCADCCTCWYCDRCDCHRTEDDYRCENCESCEDCCDCYCCSHCGEKFDRDTDDYCRECDRCSGCCDCEKESGSPAEGGEDEINGDMGEMPPP